MNYPIVSQLAPKPIDTIRGTVEIGRSNSIREMSSSGVGEISSGTFGRIGRPAANAEVSGSETDAASSAVENRQRELLKAISTVGQYLDESWRLSLVARIRNIVNDDEWDRADALPSLDSFITFLRAVVFINPTKRPGVGFGSNGHLLAMWASKGCRISLEFMPADRLRWVLSRKDSFGVERAAGENSIARLPDVLSPYGAEGFFSDAERVLK